jgi:peptidoglycan/LPS O-acetylase OafA/YrhL
VQHERRCAVAVLVAVAVPALSALPALQAAGTVVFVCLALLVLALVVRFTAAEDGSPRLTRRSAWVWLACALLSAAVFVPGPPESMGVLMLRCLGVLALLEALASGSRDRQPMAGSAARSPP